MALGFLDGLVKYPDTLPCPQVDTNLVPRERRYISDITDVRNMRMFQQEFQATRNRISFIFTEEEAREFREWYENDLVYGGAWFYADWPTLHKDKEIAHRFVGQPKYEWLLGANPGAAGRSVAGYTPNTSVVPLYKITATVEIYDSGYGGYGGRKVGKYAKTYTSKLYPLYISDDIADTFTHIEEARKPPRYYQSDDFASGPITFSVTEFRYIYTDKEVSEHIAASPITIAEATEIRWIYTTNTVSDDITASHIGVVAEFGNRVVAHADAPENITASHITIEGETS